MDDVVFAEGTEPKIPVHVYVDETETKRNLQSSIDLKIFTRKYDQNKKQTLILNPRIRKKNLIIPNLYYLVMYSRDAHIGGYQLMQMRTLGLFQYGYWYEHFQKDHTYFHTIFFSH